MNATRLLDAGVPGRRQRLMRVGVAVLALFVFVVIPGYLASRPDFYRRVPSVADEHSAWSTSTHLEASCDACHVPPEPLARAAYRVRVVGEFYLSLAVRSRIPQVFASPTNDACLACHSDLRTVSPKGDLQIPHRAHVSILEMECVECHNYLVHELSPEGQHTPPMVECLRCHDGDTAQDACTACHTEKAAPENHAAEDWVIVHAERATDPECTDCHKWAEDWCADCHSKRPQSHGSDWRAVHGDRILIHRSCEACHEGAFCVPCHGEIPQLNYDPRLRLVQ